jgi:hypothetical protein
MTISGTAQATAVFLFTVAVGQNSQAQDANWRATLIAAKKEGMLVAASSTLSGRAAVAVMNAFREKFGVSLELFPAEWR